MPDGGIRIFYMGGDGPHDNGGVDKSGAGRNTSFGLATLRPQGFAGISGSGKMTTRPLKASGTAVTITADILAPGGYGPLHNRSVAHPFLLAAFHSKFIGEQ